MRAGENRSQWRTRAARAAAARRQVRPAVHTRGSGDQYAASDSAPYAGQIVVLPASSRHETDRLYE